MSDIIKVPGRVLREIARPVKTLDKHTLDIISDMRKTLLTQRDPEGVGIAAPQIGIPLRIFFIRPMKKEKPGEPILFINPEITHFSKNTTSPQTKGNMLEGCLSLPHYYGFVRRSKSITVKFQSINHQFPIPNKSDLTLDIDRLLIEKSETFSDFPAQIIQHELDHLNGTLFIDRILEQNGKLYEVHGDDWKQVSI